MSNETLSPTLYARRLDEAKERATALRRAAVNDALDALGGGLRRLVSALATRAGAGLRGPRPVRQLEA